VSGFPADGRENGHAVYQKAQIGGSGRGTYIIFPHESLEIAAATMVRIFSPPGSLTFGDGLAPDGFYFPRLHCIHSAPLQGTAIFFPIPEINSPK
jgi:hypothetical protein